MSTCTSGKRCAVIRQVQWCTTVQTLVNCHCELKENSIRDVEPVELVVQQLMETTSQFEYMLYACHIMVRRRQERQRDTMHYH